MAFVQYKKVVIWDASLVDVGFSDTDVSSGLKGGAINALKITTGAPATNAGYFLPGAVITNVIDGTEYINSGTQAAPVWSLNSNANISGDATVSATGVLTLSQNVRQVEVKISLTTTQIKALNGTPVALVAAQGAGTIIRPLSVDGRMNFLTAAYGTNTTLNVGYASGSDPLFTNTTLLPVTAGNPIQPFFPLAQAGVTGNDNEYIANASLNVSVPSGNPATGSGTLDIYVVYQVITL